MKCLVVEMSVCLLTCTEVLQILKTVRYHFPYITYTMLYTVPSIHMYCHNVRALKLVVVFSYKTRITSCQWTVSRCNIIGIIQTRHITVTPHYLTIISHKSPRPILSLFSVKAARSSHSSGLHMTRRFLVQLRTCYLTTNSLWQPCSHRRHKEVAVGELPMYGFVCLGDFGGCVAKWAVISGLSRK